MIHVKKDTWRERERQPEREREIESESQVSFLIYLPTVLLDIRKGSILRVI